MEQYFKSKLIEIGVDVNRSVKEYFFGSENYFEETLKLYPTNDDLFNKIYEEINNNNTSKAFEYAYQLQIQMSFLCFDVVYNKVTRAIDKFRRGTTFGTKNLFDQVNNRYHDFILIVKEMKGEIQYE